MKSFRHLFCVCSYLCFSLLAFFILENNFNAEVNRDNYVYFDYTDNYIINNVNPSFFGRNGYLDKVYGILPKLNTQFSILFSKDDIYVIKNLQVKYKNFIFHYSEKENRTYIKTNGYKGYMIKLSDFNNFDEFYSALSNTDNWPSFNGFEDKFYTTHNISKLNKDYSYFDGKVNDFLIPYYDFYRVNISGSSNCLSGYICNSIYFNGIESNFTKSPVEVQTYFNMYGFNLPRDSKYSKIYSIDSLIKLEDLDSFKVNASFNTDIKPNISGVKVYGMKDDEGLYHWEDVTYKTGKDKYLSLDYSEPVYNNGVYSFSYQKGSYANLNEYKYIYIKFILNGANETYNHSVKGTNTKHVYVNNIYQDGIIDSIYLNTGHTIIFSTTEEKYPGYFFYEILSDSEDVNGGNFYGRFNEISIFDMEEYTTKKDFKYSVREYTFLNNGMFHRLDYEIFGRYNMTGIYTHLRNSDSSFSKHTKYVYKPVDDNGKPIMYVSYRKIDSDYEGADIIHVDSNGKPINGHLDSSFDTPDDKTFLDRLINIIIPTNTQLNIGIEELKTALSNKLGGIWQLLEVPINIFSDLLNNDSTNSCINFPSLTEPFSGITFYSGDSFCFSEFREKVPPLFAITDLIISIVATLSLGNVFYHKIKRITGGVS